MSGQAWRTATLGLHKTVAKYRQALKDGGFKVRRWADDLLEKTPFATTVIPVNLYCVTGHDLGFTTIYTTAQFFEAVKSHGFTKLPAETGPALRLDYNNQPDGEIIHVGMEPILDSDNNLYVFIVGHDGRGQWLDTCYAGPTNEWYPEDVWVVGRS